MIKVRLSINILLIFLLTMFPCKNVLGENQLTEQQALDVLVSQIQKDKLYESWTTLSCLNFLPEENTKEYFDIGIYEKHGGKCPGDPNTSPVVDRFRVDRLSNKIQWYEPTEGEYLPYKAVLKARLKKVLDNDD